ncbi:streptogrisin C [Allocatelliglobosispora scoriae]|uniref:Streptogrisin C n=1 Tax=Allocatelliglobosispora scoriae TaxID=643052 RepID=A0A841BJZ3_9ACTN|nr:S1 family peptidase [Allocatelliglobosispora scoriae]MBB5867092.1 streptogrisin C [Allocatelliglobosispora scoriae]
MGWRNSRLAARVLAVGAAITVGVTGGVPANAGLDARGGARPQGASATVMAALQRDLGLTADQVNRRLAQESVAVKLDAEVRATMGAEFAGSWFDPGSGTLVVAVTSAQAAARITASGAQARMVRHPMSTLRAITDKLDGLAGRANPASRSHAVDGLVGWYIDPVANSVVVTALQGATRAAALDLFAGYEDAVRVEYTDRMPTPATNAIDGGDVINRTCSAGFNLRNPTTGQGYLLTAGHCVAQNSGVRGQGGPFGIGVFFGTAIISRFPSADDAIVRNESAGYWIQGPWMDLNPSNGNFAYVVGTSDAPVGTSICKSGITTKLTCGTITAKRETVTYSGGRTVYDLTRHNACVEGGDSGGPNTTQFGTAAEGVTSGSNGYSGRCGEVYGYANVSWYYPIVLSLALYGQVYGATLW